MKPKILYCKSRLSAEPEKLKYPIVLLRGLGRSMGFWLDFEKELARYSDVIMVDLLGIGGSKSLLGRGRISHFAQDVIHTLNQKVLVPKFHLAGISLGGMVALEIYKKFNHELVNKNVMLASVCVMNSSSAGMKMIRINRKPLLVLLFEFLRSFGFFPLKHKYLSRYLVVEKTLQKNKSLIQKWDSLLIEEGFSHIAVLRQLLAASKYHFQIKNHTSQIPTLFLVSKADALVPWENSIVLWQNTPNSELIIFDELGHDLTTDDPALVAQCLHSFCRRSEGL